MICWVEIAWFQNVILNAIEIPQCFYLYALYINIHINIYIYYQNKYALPLTIT